MCGEYDEERREENKEKALLIKKARLLLKGKFSSLPWELSNRLAWLTNKQLEQLLIDCDFFTDFMAFEIWLMAARIKNKLLRLDESYWRNGEVSFSEYDLKWFLTVMTDLKEFEKI